MSIRGKKTIFFVGRRGQSTLLELTRVFGGVDSVTLLNAAAQASASTTA